jgi:hypothetical protein
MTIALTVRTPEDVARNSFADRPVAEEIASVPVEVIGLPETDNHVGTVIAT